jgi:hypothetical protein
MTKPPVRRLALAHGLPGCLRLAVGRGWGAEEHTWRFLFEHGEVHGIDAPDGDGLAGTTVLARRLMTQVIDSAGDATVTLHATDRGRPLCDLPGDERRRHTPFMVALG